jgi:hypothetical protein
VNWWSHRFAPDTPVDRFAESAISEMPRPPAWQLGSLAAWQRQAPRSLANRQEPSHTAVALNAGAEGIQGSSTMSHPLACSLTKHYPSLGELLNNLQDIYISSYTYAMDSTDTMDVADVAAFLKAEPETIAQYARAGELAGTRIGKGWIFLREDVLAFLRGRKANRPQRKPQTAAKVQAVLVERRPRTRRTQLPTLPTVPAPGQSP